MTLFADAGSYAAVNMETLLNSDSPQTISSTSLTMIPDASKTNITKMSVYPTFLKTKLGNIVLFSIVSFALLLFLAGFK